MLSYFRTYLLPFFAILQILHFFTNVSGQDVEATIEINPNSPTNAIISGKFLDQKFASKNRNLSFVRSLSGISNLGRRLSEVKLNDSNGSAVPFLTAVPGEYVADAPFTNWSYAIDLKPLKEQTAAAHVSWINANEGLLMLDDLLPIVETATGRMAANITLITPGSPEEVVRFEDTQNAVIPIGNTFRKTKLQVEKSIVNISISGSWLFSDDELASFSREIIAWYGGVFGSAPREINIAVTKMPNAPGYGIWQADTRGKNITIVSSDMPFKTQSVQRLHEQLRHEIFHLWIPNSVGLSGRYDWFYEGFALYSSLRLAVAKSRIRFEDFLDTLSRAHEVDKRQTSRMSLIDVSRNRWNGSETYLYARGMVTAFLIDVTLLNSSKRKTSVIELLREVYRKHQSSNERTDGNTAVIAILRKHPELAPIVERYINGSGPIDWQNELSAAGLIDSNGLIVSRKLSGKQKDVLDALGYNNSQRQSPSK